MLAKLAKILGERGISIASLIQHDPGDDEPDESPVPLVIMTHLADPGRSARGLARDRPARRRPCGERLPGRRRLRLSGLLNHLNMPRLTNLAPDGAGASTSGADFAARDRTNDREVVAMSNNLEAASCYGRGRGGLFPRSS